MDEVVGRKSTTARIQVIFDGNAVREGMIDALVLADALSSYSAAFTRANFLINGSESEASVLVDANFEKGSFDVPLLLVQSLQQAQGIFGGLKTALELAFIIGIVRNPDSVVELLRFLKGRPPEGVRPQKDGVEYELDGEKKTVPQTTHTLYYDPSTRKALEDGTRSLENPGISSISFRHDNDEAVVLNKDDVPSFKANDFSLVDEEPTRGERDAIITISKLSFKEGTKWSFFEGGSSLTARIEDEDFFKQVHERKLKFADGDRLYVHLVWQLHDSNGRLRAENVITKVHRVLTSKHQLRLDGGEDEAV